jgi:hypothetical protein
MTETKVEFIFKEAYGYRLRGTVEEWNESAGAWAAIDISSFTTKQFKIKKPDGVTVTIPADFETDGTDGVLVYVIPSGSILFNQVGFYDWQAILANAAQYFPTEIQGFKIDDPI